MNWKFFQKFLFTSYNINDSSQFYSERGVRFVTYQIDALRRLHERLFYFLFWLRVEWTGFYPQDIGVYSNGRESGLVQCQET